MAARFRARAGVGVGDGVVMLGGRRTGRISASLAKLLLHTIVSGGVTLVNG